MGRFELIFLLSVFIGITSAIPRIELIKMESTHECSKEFLLNGTDTTTIVYNISGINREYVAKGSKGPALFYKFTWGEIEKICRFLPRNASCDGQLLLNKCNCDLISKGRYQLTFILEANVSLSRMGIFAKWPSSRRRRNGTEIFEVHKLPLVRSSNAIKPHRKVGRGSGDRIGVNLGVVIGLVLATLTGARI